MSFDPLPSALAAEIDRAAAAAPDGAEQVTVELAVSPCGRVAPTPRRASDTTPYIGVEMTLQRGRPAGAASEAATGGVDAICRRAQE